MIDVSTTHPFEACTAFAIQFIRHLADGDLASAEAMVDINDAGGAFSQWFLEPVPGPGGFTYARPDQMIDWSMYIIGASEKGLGLDFEVPFAEAEYAGRSLSARFQLRRIGNHLEVRLTGAVPN